ncbi:hypothetical protein CKM354_000877100 [Cercospora kikuchii]|uniref:BTB domain-containing protein n=1 Tax=Cercospora kikuchii TaxID=84275 RepID=A0A9P3CLW4_9PEZI|nr:uncharacterized protein CKM354_000877100 [Cercospora kikuchii]GIZ45612.1 hypothetical protein CKM354_000877100 [Cercospora kikuchii]
MADSIGATPGEVPTGPKPLLKTLRKAWYSPAYSDLKITCNGWEWEVHRVIVCHASEFFKSCCENFKEASTGIVDLPDDDREVVGAMLTYLYTADYNDKINIGVPRTLFQVHVHTIADKYGILDLCRVAEAKFAELATSEWKGPDFAQAVEEMFTTAPDSKRILQKTALSIVVKHAKVLFTDESSVFAEISRKVAPFAHEVSTQLLTAKLREGENELRYECPACKETFICKKFAVAPDDFTAFYAYCPCCNRKHHTHRFTVVESRFERTTA